MKPTVEYYKDAADEWRWRVKARNGRIISDSGEGYGRRSDAVLAFERVANYAHQTVLKRRKTDE